MGTPASPTQPHACPAQPLPCLHGSLTSVWPLPSVPPHFVPGQGGLWPSGGTASRVGCLSVTANGVLSFLFVESQVFICLFLAFEVILDDILGLRFFAIILNYHTTATNHFPVFSLTVGFTEACLFTEFLVVINFN